MRATLATIGLGMTVWALMTLGGCMVAPGVQGSGVARTETREVAPFSKVDSTGSADILVTLGQQQSLTIEADDNILPLIDTEVRGDRLVISSHGSYSPKVGIRVTITIPSFDGATIAGSGTVVADNLTSKHFAAQVSGSGDIVISGKGESITASVAGSGDIDASRFVVESAEVQVTGSGDIKVNATKSLSAQVTGSGDVRYSGNPPQVQKSVTGSGSVKPM